MVYLEPVHLGWEPLIDTWNKKFKSRNSAMYYELACKYIKSAFKKGLPFVREE